MIDSYNFTNFDAVQNLRLPNLLKLGFFCQNTKYDRPQKLVKTMCYI